ncbi:DoxX family protein [Phytomonospora endophytica]|uniref:Putative membrane protein YphA (DoxX/SURF4 family) n=1 Tax=Phytomonospora endophytica TaxID=714109 RepID=A0A841FG15_9ACTN|nr:DoxX family protein [Phytomonospora endophytica]MBB6034545.1 putative membrane protein YphA (DoxX/SURF4 family) [Phytomonospora endophytica]GIG70454.1 hypothetical protein Pen01_67490 [Phytomonospora endophytica]
MIEAVESSRLRAYGYWAATLIIAAESALGGVWDVLRTDYVRDVLEVRLGYPWYVAVLLGVWKIPGAIVLILPRLPRLKEWVYAGVVFVYSGAFVSHLAVGETAAAFGPLGFALITAVSWALRPESRRDPAPYGRAFARLLPKAPARRTATTVVYWVTTVAFVGALFSGGIADLLHREETLAGMVALGYPPYFLYIIGAWKVLGTAAFLAPGFGRLKEWAYAGAFFNFTGAAVSHAFSGSASWHVVYTSLFALTVLVSWAARPPDRVLGDVRTGRA